MSQNTASSSGPPSGGITALIYSARARSLFFQALLILGLTLGVYEIVLNTQANLAKLGQSFGFDFFQRSAGFDLSTTLIAYESNSTFARALLAGFWNTVLVSGLAIILSTALGLVIGIMRLSSNFIIAQAATLYVEITRNIPLLLQLFIWYALVLKPLPQPRDALNLGNTIFFSNRGVVVPHPIFGDNAWWGVVGLVLALLASLVLWRWAKARQAATGQAFPAIWASLGLILFLPLLAFALAGWPLTLDYPALAGFNFRGGMVMVPEFVALLLGLTVYTAGYVAEIVRAGIVAVSKGQKEAAAAIGLRDAQSLRLVVLPQAMRLIIPPLGNQWVGLTKNSTLAVAIGYPDFFYTAGAVNNITGRAIEAVMILMAVYLTLSLITSALLNWFNARMKLVER